MVVHPPAASTFAPEENTIVGNVSLYGATGGEVFLRGLAGERFCVRNSGVTAIVEGVGDHGCEYMTGGRVVVLGPAGRNFAAGMSGGIAYIFDPEEKFARHLNPGMVELEDMDSEDSEFVFDLVRRHQSFTQSTVAAEILANWDENVHAFRKVMPTDYRRVLEERKQRAAQAPSATV